MKKKILAWVLIFCLVLPTYGCGSQKADDRSALSALSDQSLSSETASSSSELPPLTPVGEVLGGAKKAETEKSEAKEAESSAASETETSKTEQETDAKTDNAKADSASTKAESQKTDSSSSSDKKQPLFVKINHYLMDPIVNSYISKAGKERYKVLVAGVLARKEVITLTDDYDTNLALMMAFKDTPYDFFIKSDTFSKDHKAVKIEYAYTEEEQTEMLNYIDNEYLSILNSCITKDMSEESKVMAIYRYFAERISYNYGWTEALDMSDQKYLFPEIEVYEALKTNLGVCHSYSYLCEFALRQMGIECIHVTGQMKDDPDTGHMWLIVKMDGEYFHCDPTWDSKGAGESALDYFGMTDKEREASGIDMSTVIIDSAYGPVVCNDSRFANFHHIIEDE